MRRMFSYNQLEELIKKYAPEVSPADIQAMFDEGEVSLAGKYVRIMDAPTSTTLTNEQIEQIKEGVFIDGDFLELHNPIILPFIDYNTVNYLGIIIGAPNVSYQNCIICSYTINKSTKVISLARNTRNLSIDVSKLNDKTIPSYPANTGTFTLKCVDGTLSWVAD